MRVTPALHAPRSTPNTLTLRQWTLRVDLSLCEADFTLSSPLQHAPFHCVLLLQLYLVWGCCDWIPLVAPLSWRTLRDEQCRSLRCVCRPDVCYTSSSGQEGSHALLIISPSTWRLIIDTPLPKHRQSRFSSVGVQYSVSLSQWLPNEQGVTGDFAVEVAAPEIPDTKSET